MSDKVSKSQIKGHGAKWDRKKHDVIAALLSSGTMKAAAEQAGIAESTLWRWSKLQEFKQAYKEARREAVGAAIAHLQQTAADAVKCLRDVMTDDEAPANARVSAARSVLEISMKAIELEDLEERLSELETLLEGRDGP